MRSNNNTPRERATWSARALSLSLCACASPPAPIIGDYSRAGRSAAETDGGGSRWTTCANPGY